MIRKKILELLVLMFSHFNGKQISILINLKKYNTRKNNKN